MCRAREVDAGWEEAVVLMRLGAGRGEAGGVDDEESESSAKGDSGKTFERRSLQSSGSVDLNLERAHISIRV